jgi:hypothetical protein
MTLSSVPTVKPFADTTGQLSARDEAISYLKGLVLDVLLDSPEPLKTVEVARAVMERCGMSAEEHDPTTGNFAGLIRLVLDSDPAFLHENRQWDLAARRPRPDADRRRPVERAIEDTLQWIGKPVTPAELAPFIAAIYGRDAEFYEGMLERLAPTRPQFFVAEGGRVGLSRWLVDTSGEDPDEVALDNFEEESEWKPYAPATLPEAENALDFAVALLRAAGQAVPSRPLLYLAWRSFPDVEPQALFNDLIEEKRVALAHGPLWMAADVRAAKLAAVGELTSDAELAASVLATAAPVVEEEAGGAPAPAAPPVRVAEADLDQVYAYMNKDLRSFRLSELCQEILESFPGSRTYPAVRDALREQMLADSRFIWVGTERFRLDGTLPDEVVQVPEGLTFDERHYTDEDEEVVDKILPLERWKHALDEQILHPLVQDLGDDASVRSTAPPAQLRAAPPLHHYIVGTLYLRNDQRGLLPAEPEMAELTLIAPDESRIDVWLNNRLGLLYGLKEWYDANLPWTGGVFTLEATAVPDEFRLNYTGEREPLMDVATERLQQILLLRGQAEGEEITLTEALTRILRGHPHGVSFVTLFTELNIVRRCRRAMVASVLSAHRGFQQRPEEPGLWFFDERRAEKSSKKSGRPKRIREIEDTEEDLDV